MEEWKEYKLGEITIMKNGKKRPQGIGCYPVYGGNGIMDYTDCFNSERSIIVGRVGAYCGCVYKCDEKCWVSDNAISVSATELVDFQFLYYLMSTIDFHHHHIGGAQPLMTQDIIGDFEVKLPKLAAQKDIAIILSSLDDKIELNRRINRNLEEQAQALFKSWFVDFEPFWDGEFVDSELGMIPKGWRVQTASDVFEINIGKTPPRKETKWFSESNEDKVWVSISDMGSCGVFISDSSEYLTSEAINRFNVLMVEKDTILLSFKLTIGRVAIADKTLTTNEAIARFILPIKSFREFLYLYLKQFQYANLGSTSSIATAVNSKTIKNMKLLIPSLDVIDSFSVKLKPLFEQIRFLQQESSRLASLRDTLLPRLMSGELKVNEINI